MFYDPIQRLLDYQLRSRQGRLQELLILGCFPQISVGTEQTEEMLIEAIDRKYFSGFLWSEREERVLAYRREGWTQVEIAAFEKISHVAVNKILKKFGATVTKD